MQLPLPLVRNAVFGITNGFASLILGLAIYTIAATSGYLGGYFTFSALAVATALLHLISVISMIVVGRNRHGALISKVYFEVGWLSFLCIMWLATGSQTAASLGGAFSCSLAFCGVSQAIAAFGFFIWIILLAYIGSLTAAAVKASHAGKNIWYSDVKEVQWVQFKRADFEKHMGTPNSATYPPGSDPNYPPGSMQNYPPNGDPNYPNYAASPVNPQPQSQLQPNYPQYTGNAQV